MRQPESAGRRRNRRLYNRHRDPMVRNNKKRHAGTTEFAHRLRTGISKRLSRNEYRILVEQAPVMIWRVNTNAECDYCNNGWLQFRGRSLEQEYGYQWAEGADRKRCLATYLEAFKKRGAI